jgi:hypothetical protein
MSKINNVIDLKTLEIIDYIIQEIKKDVWCSDYIGVVDTPNGTRQESSIDLFDHEYINQKCGCCEDDYYGEIYFPVNDKYIVFGFQA